ncbi:hypothetical protein BDZ97DRAFT_1765558 [Flammula alnicola]|nr:hypothetical protein BDZ97DRAFT_1765558 [Flammula alnicola]
MRRPFYTLFLSAISLFSLFPVLVSSIHPHALTRRDYKRSPPPSNVLTSRQHRVARDLLDVCINVNVDLLADASQLLGLGGLLGPLDLGSKIQLCLCLKASFFPFDLDLYLDTNVDIQALVGLLGKNAVSALITALINTSPEAQQCTFPSNAHHTCDNADPCHFECDANYVLQGDTCVCAPPNMSCNGVCGSFPQGCGSAVPNSMKKRTESIVTIGQAKAICPHDAAVCGIPGRENTFAFECIDTKTTKDSCGGCMVPHSFFEAEPVRQSSGKDCSSITNVKSSSCSNGGCVVHSCNDGWLPSPTNDECVPAGGFASRMRRVNKRSNPLATNVTADANINSDLVSQLVAIVKMVLDLTSHTPSSSPAVPNSSASPSTSTTISALLQDVNVATGTLLSSSTIAGLLSNTNALLDTSSLLSSMLNDQGLGLAGVSRDLDNIIAATINLKDWCAHNPIVSSSSSTGSTYGSGQTDKVPPLPNFPDQAIVVGLSDLLSSLGLNGKSGVAVSGIDDELDGTVNNVLSGLSLGPNNYRRDDLADIKANAMINSDLLAKIVALVNLVVGLGGDATALPPPPASSTAAHSAHPSNVMPSINTDLFDSIAEATANIVNAPTVSSLVSAIDSLVSTTGVVSGLLGQCGCVDALGLGPFVANLDKVAIAALDMQSWCHGHSVAMPAPSSPSPVTDTPVGKPPASPVPSTIANTDDVPIVVGLSNLLTGLGLLGPVKAGATVDGLGSGLSGTVNDLLNELSLGPQDVKRRDGSPLSASATVNSELLARIEGLVDLVLGFQGSMSSLPAAGSPASHGSLDPSLVTKVVQDTGEIIQSTTVSGLLSNIDALVDADKVMQDAFAGCGCLKALGLEQAVKYLDKVTEAALGLKSWCASNPIVVSPSAARGAGPSSTSIRTVFSVGIAPTSTLHSVSASTHVTTPPVVPHSTLPPVSSTVVHLPSPSSSSDSGDVPIVIDLDHLLAGLGLGGIKTVASVDGLGNGLDTTTDGLLNGLDIGPDDVRRRRAVMKRQNLMTERAKRQIVANANATVDSDLLGLIDALVDLVLGLNDAATSLPTPATIVPTHATTVHVSVVPLSTLSGSKPVSSGLTPSVDSSLVDSIVNATTALLSSATMDELVAETDALVSASILALTTVEGCGCMQDLGLDSVYDYLVKIVDASLGLQDWCHGHLGSSSGSSPSAPFRSPAPPTPSSSGTSAGDEPLVVGLTKLLNGLGLGIKTDVVVDGLLGNGLDHTVNSLLNGLGIGPNGARRRFILPAHES